MDDKIKKVKEECKPTDALPLFEAIISKSKDWSDKEREDINKVLEESFENAGNLMLDRALTDGTVTEEEWKEWSSWGMEPKDFAPILQGHYNRIDGHIGKKEKVILITMPKSPMHTHRKFFSKKFNVKIVTPDESVKIMIADLAEKMSPDEFKKFMKNMDKLA